MLEERIDLYFSVTTNQRQVVNANEIPLRDSGEIMATLADVKAWWVLRGIGHIVAAEKLGFLVTACNAVTTGSSQHKRPKRKCRRCMKRLPEAEVVMYP